MGLCLIQGGLREGSKRFFFEKKKQKTFTPRGVGAGRGEKKVAGV
jgi:hypothetical protein